MCQCVVRTVIMYFLYQGLHALVLVSEYGEYRIRFLVVVWSACLMVGPVGDLVSLHSGPLVCRSSPAKNDDIVCALKKKENALPIRL